MAMDNIIVRNAMIIWFLNIDFNNITSVKLAHALPIINAISAPRPIPFAAKAALKGMTVSALIYKGIPITAAIGTAKGVFSLATLAINSVGINP